MRGVQGEVRVSGVSGMQGDATRVCKYPCESYVGPQGDEAKALCPQGKGWCSWLNVVGEHSSVTGDECAPRRRNPGLGKLEARSGKRRGVLKQGGHEIASSGLWVRIVSFE